MSSPVCPVKVLLNIFTPESHHFLLQSTILAPPKVVLSKVVQSAAVSDTVYPTARSWRIPKGDKWRPIARPTTPVVDSRRLAFCLLVYVPHIEHTSSQSERVEVVIITTKQNSDCHSSNASQRGWSAELATILSISDLISFKFDCNVFTSSNLRWAFASSMKDSSKASCSSSGWRASASFESGSIAGPFSRVGVCVEDEGLDFLGIVLGRVTIINQFRVTMRYLFSYLQWKHMFLEE